MKPQAQTDYTRLLVGLGACVLLLAFIALARMVVEGYTLAFDTGILRALRTPGDTSKPIGPVWVEIALFDLTALGGQTLLGLLVASVTGYLLLQRRYHTAWFVPFAWGTGKVLEFALKHAFIRARPTVVVPLVQAFDTSFPSGHAMESAIVYLTLAVLVTRITDRRITKLYCFGIAVVLTLLVGVSRVYLGVHYPTDVLAGWIVGMLWVSIFWLTARQLDPADGPAAERREAARR